MALITFNHSVVMGWLVAMSSQYSFVLLCLVLCGSEEEMEDFVSSPKILKLAGRLDFRHIQHLKIIRDGNQELQARGPPNCSNKTVKKESEIKRVCEAPNTKFSSEESQRGDRVKGSEKSCSKYRIAMFNRVSQM